MKNLYLVRGLPGSGKSTLALILANGDSFLVCEADKYFIDKKTGEYKFDVSKIKEAHESCRATVEMYMHDSTMNNQFYNTIVVSNTFTQEWEMKAYYELAEKYGYRVFSIIVENRHGGVNEHGVPDDKLEVMKNRFEIKLL
jgi:predicted kinase